ncbi:MAG: hypothetical protein EOO24_16020, partial [Comamonadaceae bacterium]
MQASARLVPLIVACPLFLQNLDTSIMATALTEGKVSAAQLIVTPSKGAAKDTRLWAESLRKNVDQSGLRIRDVLAIDLPFFMSEEDAIG